jgi:hypothetical protein
MESTSFVVHTAPLEEIRPAPGAPFSRAFFRLFDRPTREILETARAPFPRTIALAVSGLGMVVLASVIAALPMTRMEGRKFWEIDILRPWMEALVFVVPSLVTFSAYLRLKLTPRVIFSAMAIGLLFAGVLALSVLPLVGFLMAMAWSVRDLQQLLTLVPAVVAFGTVVAVSTRHLGQLDTSTRAAWVLKLFLFISIALFAERTLTHLHFDIR